ncbi:helix-turn-helix domain-containing protein [Pseudomonas indica]|uniref:AraC-type DNA-binding protein n=1 Tax=Pseudomonas indica TaxID=137658 RepID=A0A1G9BXZ7_9PSED|nr:AraC family transcriptional regulator [Pseudomonas indica]SDK44319.1 AraC-type DNA-binding protein [Pseudomonas indica]
MSGRYSTRGHADFDPLLERTEDREEAPATSSRQAIRLSAWQERRAKELIAAHLGSGLSIARLARECSLSRSHFSRAFHGSTGVSPHQWLTRQRIEHAKRLLLDDLLITRIAQDCGFADQAHFSRVFTRLVGLSPSRWRLGLLRGKGIARERCPSGATCRSG